MPGAADGAAAGQDDPAEQRSAEAAVAADPHLGPGPSAEEEAELEQATSAIMAAFEAKGLEVLAPTRRAIRKGLLLRGGAAEVERDALAAMALDTAQVSAVAPGGPWDELGRTEVEAMAKRKGALATAGTTVGEHALASAADSRSPEYTVTGATARTKGAGGQGAVGFSGVRWTPADRTQLLVGGPEPAKKKKSAGGKGKGKSKGKSAGGGTAKKAGKKGAKSAAPKKAALPPVPAQSAIPGIHRTGPALLPGSLLPGRDIPSHPLPDMRDAVFKKKGGKKKRKKKGKKK